MSSSSRRIIAQSAACDDESEPLNSANTKMRNRLSKRRKLRSIVVVMLSGVAVAAVIGVIFLTLVGFSDQAENLTYDGE